MYRMTRLPRSTDPVTAGRSAEQGDGNGAMLKYNEGKVCDAIVRHLESREGAKRWKLKTSFAGEVFDRKRAGRLGYLSIC